MSKPPEYNSLGFCINCGNKGMVLSQARRCESCSKAKRNARDKERKQQEPGYRAKRNAQQRAINLRRKQNDPDYKAKINADRKAYYHKKKKDPAYKEKLRLKSARRNDIVKKLKNEDPEYRAKINAQQRAYYKKYTEDPEYSIKVNIQNSIAFKKRMKNPEYRNKRNAWYRDRRKNDLEYTAKRYAKKNKLRRKQYSEDPLHREKVRLLGAERYRRKVMLKNQIALFSIKLELDRRNKNKDVKT